MVTILLPSKKHFQEDYESINVEDYGISLIDNKGRNFIKTEENPFLVSDQFGLYLYVLEDNDNKKQLTRLNKSLESVFSRSTYINTESMFFEENFRKLNIQRRNEIPFGLHETIISDVRANRPGKLPDYKNIDPEHEKKECADCIFEKSNVYNKTPKPRIFFPELTIKDFVPVSVPNPYGYMVMGRVNAFTNHEKKDPKKIDQVDMYNFLKISKRNAQIYKSQGHTDMISIINFLKLAGASQIHPHSQDAVVSPNAKSLVNLERLANKEINKYYPNIMKEMNAIYKNSELFTYENEGSLVYAPFAPKFPDQLDITTKFEKVTNFLNMREEDINYLSDSLSKSINFLSTKRDVTDFNLLVHQSKFDETDSNYCLHFHLMPRNKNTLAGFELNGIYIVDTYPENTAKAMRDYLDELKKLKLKTG